MLITNPWKYKIKNLNGGTIIWSLYEKQFLLIILSISYRPGPNNHIKDELKLESDLSNYSTKNT